MSTGISKLCYCFFSLRIRTFNCHIFIVYNTGFHNNVYIQVHNTLWPCFFLCPSCYIPRFLFLLFSFLCSHFTFAFTSCIHTWFYVAPSNLQTLKGFVFLSLIWFDFLLCLDPIGSCFRQILLAPMYCLSRVSDESFYLGRPHTSLCHGQAGFLGSTVSAIKLREAPQFGFICSVVAVLRFLGILSLNVDG